MDETTTPLVDVVKSKVFVLGGTEYGEKFTFANPEETARWITNGFTPPNDLNADPSRYIKLKREFKGHPSDQIRSDDALQTKLTEELDVKYGNGNWRLAGVVSSFDQARGNDAFYDPKHIVLIKDK